MFSPKLKSKSFLSSTSLPKTPSQLNSRLSLRKKSSLYTAKAKSFLTPNSSIRNRSLNVTELPLSVDKIGSSNHQLSEYDGFVPISVVNSLFTDDPISGILDDGIAWSINNDDKKLVIWDLNDKSEAYQELNLPSVKQSTPIPENVENAAQFQLVAVLKNGRQSISCIVLSPNGFLVYWNNITFVQSLLKMTITSGRGPMDSCVSVVTIADGFVVGWLSGTLTYLTFSQGQLKSSTLTGYQGRLNSLGRRFSTMLFGSPSQSFQNQTSASVNNNNINSNQVQSLRKLLPGNEMETGAQEMYVLLSWSLQKWVVSSGGGGGEKMLYDANLENIIRKNLSELYGQDDFSLFLHDMQVVRDGLMILFSQVDLDGSSAKYGIAHMNTRSDEEPDDASKIVLSDYIVVIDDHSPKDFKLLWPSMNSTVFGYFYSKSNIVCFRDNEDGSSTTESVIFNSNASGCYQGQPLLLTNQGCLVTIQDVTALANQSIADSLMRSKVFSTLDTSILGSASVEQISQLYDSDDILSKFKAIFISSMCLNSNLNNNNNTTSANSTTTTTTNYILSQLFPDNNYHNNNNNQQQQRQRLDQLRELAVELSRQMIDDYPQSDPRWLENIPNNNVSQFSTSSVILSHQLTDKKLGHDSYVQFLRNSGIWEMLSDCGDISKLLIQEHSEKVACTIILRELHVVTPDILDRAIESCMRSRRSSSSSSSSSSLGQRSGLLASSSSSSSLSSIDLYYREISRMQEIFKSLVSTVDDYIKSTPVENNSDCLKLINSTTDIFKLLLEKALSFNGNNNNNNNTNNNSNNNNNKVFIPWTARDDVVGPMLRYHGLISAHILPRILMTNDNIETKNLLFQDLLIITDIILGTQTTIIDLWKQNGRQEKGRVEELVSNYEELRGKLLLPFVEFRQYERAIPLAEKYCDFALLVQLCEEMADDERLEDYVNRFNDLGFPEIAFKWYCNTGKRGKLFSSGVFLNNPKLKAFMDRPENKNMSWLYYVKKMDFKRAHEITFELANEEKDNLAKKKTFYSHAKLYWILADEGDVDGWKDRLMVIENNLDLILHQEQLFSNPYIRECLSIDAGNNIRVYSPVELIDLYIGKFNVDSNEYDFKKALDLLKFCDDNDPDSPKLDIMVDLWSKCILKDRWTSPLNTANPLSTITDTIFFKTIELILSEASPIEELLPHPNDLLSEENELLADLSTNPEFQCKIMMAYEYISKFGA